jgi:type I restriction enzyme, R subunit
MKAPTFLQNPRFNSKQQAFLDFVLSHYFNVEVEDAVADLGRPEEIGRVFVGFQKYLYQQQAMA